MNDHVQVERNAGLVTLRLNRPEKKNSLTNAMYGQLAEALRSAGADSSVRAVLITGGDDCFTSGNDVADFLQNPPRDMSSNVFHFMLALFEFSKPVVAAVCGPAVGIGTTLLLHCDLVYTQRDALLRMPFVNLGLCPEFGSSLILPQMLGHAKAAELLLLGESFSGAQAAQWGIANQALEDSQATHAKALEMAMRFVQLPPSALADSKRLMRSPDRQKLREVIEEEGALFCKRLHSPEAREAMTAFMQRRQPDFSQFS